MFHHVMSKLFVAAIWLSCMAQLMKKMHLKRWMLAWACSFTGQRAATRNSLQQAMPARATACLWMWGVSHWVSLGLFRHQCSHHLGHGHCLALSHCLHQLCAMEMQSSSLQTVCIPLLLWNSVRYTPCSFLFLFYYAGTVPAKVKVCECGLHWQC